MQLLESRATRKMEKINGCRTYHHKSLSLYLAVDEDGVVIEQAVSPYDECAVRLLIDRVYRHNSEIVRRRQGYRCLLCGRSGPLEIDHHPVSRARGQRDDRVENLRALDHACHAKKHGG